jgi:hypothetical protein
MELDPRWLIMWVLCFGALTCMIAPHKGLTAGAGFLIGGVLGAVGLAHVLLRPATRAATDGSDDASHQGDPSPSAR